MKMEAKKPDPVSHPVGKSVPEGVKIKEVVKRLRASYNALPTKPIKCGADVRPDVKCSRCSRPPMRAAAACVPEPSTDATSSATAASTAPPP